MAKTPADLDEVFAQVIPKVAPVMKVFACRQVSGPKPHDDLCIRATSGVDANRQFFNYYGLNEQTYRYRLKVVVVPKEAKFKTWIDNAIECQSPQNPETLSLEEQARQHEDEIENLLSSS